MEQPERCERVLAVLACAGRFVSSTGTKAVLHSAGRKEPQHPGTGEGGLSLDLLPLAIADWWMSHLFLLSLSDLQ